MQQTLQRTIKNIQAPGRVWRHSATLSFCASCIFYEAVGAALGRIDSVVPILVSSIFGTLAFISIYKRAPRDWCNLVFFFKHWHRANGSKERRRERAREERRRLEKLEEEREQQRRIKLWKLTRQHRPEYDQERGE